MRLQCRRPNPVFSDEYRALIDVLRQVRRDAGLSQRDLAHYLGKAPSHIGMIERGQRRIDTLELYFMAKAVGLAPEVLFGRIVQRLDAVGDVATAT